MSVPKQQTPDEVKADEQYLISRGWRELPYTAGRWRDPQRHSQILKTHEALEEQRRRENLK